ncbi:hypothetical protein CEXT_620021 [Caerostris extrusa]|uniref:Uncharacterized protein n=1 Tax=Caerostris extrusa TaxID=172846 RepID=A0AAV4SDI3_CAEEX|nr:hypothetical protein CEXT_620021 [Caerostris extrusa]
MPLQFRAPVSHPMGYLLDKYPSENYYKKLEWGCHKPLTMQTASILFSVDRCSDYLRPGMKMKPDGGSITTS